MMTTWRERIGRAAAGVVASVLTISLAASPAFTDSDNDNKDKEFCKSFRGEAREICQDYCEEKRCHERVLPPCDKYRAAFLKETGTSIFPCDGARPTATPPPPGPTATPTTGTVATPTVLPPTPTPTPPPHAGGAFSLTTVGQYPLGQGDGGNATANLTDPSSVLVMPFDVTTNRASFEIVSRIGIVGDPAIDFGVIATHWSYWSESGNHLADVFICLAANDTIVVDATALQGQLRVAGNRLPVGPVINLGGTRGVLFVTAYVAAPSPFSCQPDPSFTPVDMEIVGSWTVLNLATNVSFGGNAIGSPLLADPGLLDPNNDPSASLVIQSLNPMILSDSEVYLIGVQERGGNGQFLDFEPGPIQQPFAGRNDHVCCDAEFTDSLSVRISLPDVCFAGAGFRPISADAAEAGETPILPPIVTINSSGFLRLRNCSVADGLTGAAVPLVDATDMLGNPVQEFIYAFHGQAIGG